MTTISSADRHNHTVIHQAQAPERADVVVIGAGQAGLAAGYHLAQRGLRFVILDAHERAGDAWRKRWDSLQLFTPARFSSLPGLPFPGSPHAYPTKDEVADYLETYAATMNLPIRTGTRAQWVSRATDQRWAVETDQGAFDATSVILATGGYQIPQIPAWAEELDPSILQLHSIDYRNPSQFSPGAVLVAGASHSGAEIAIEAAREHPTVLAGRDTGQVPFPGGGRLDRLITPAIWFAVDRLLTVDTPVGRKAMRHARAHGWPLERPRRSDLEAAGVRRITARAIGTQDGKPMLDDGHVLDVQNVAWCTGFRGDYSWIEGLVYGDDGYPVQNRGVVASAPGLYFVGLRFQRAGSSSLIGGVGRDAKYVVDHIAANVRKAA